MAAYATPGVYVEEIVKFPPSVAPVATAIPAFIGYTEKAIKKEEGDLHLKPTEIDSMLEFETHFGGALKEDTMTVSVLDDLISVTPPAVPKPFLMYYCMQMYFANGGGPCYIVSVGQYDVNLTAPKTIVAFGELNAGLEEIKKVDKPTLLLFPDATSLNTDIDFYQLYKNALTQCKDLQDRFTIIDTFSDEEHATDLSDSGGAPYVTLEPTESIREGMNLVKDELKYGAVYFPFLETILDYAVDEAQTDVTITESEPLDVQAEVQKISDELDTARFDTLVFNLDAIMGVVDAAGDPAAVGLLPNVMAVVNNFKDYILGIISSLNQALDLARTDGSANTEANALDVWITANLETMNLELSQALDRLNADTSEAMILNEISSDTTNVDALRRSLGIHDDDAAADSLKSLLETLKAAGGELADLIAALPASGTSAPTVAKLNTLETSDNPLYNRIKAEIGLLPIKLPPSSAMAGIYARVDSDRGVWKAPANVGVNYVIKPSIPVSHDDQKELNVHETGKSINAIRTFTGKGVLVWGARTLTGNDNEWRYVSVRRFFNMAEESIKKATEQFVFEPNDKNTWVRVKAMIENFLTAQWRAGALTGPTPEKAFYVKIGLGETMTAIDILEGNMIVEIGMAVVRPAEFIILKFSHKMQEA